MTELYDRPVRVEVSKAARRACVKRSSPLLVEMELRFGCLVTKRAHFHEVISNASGVQIDSCLFLDFRATIANPCESSGESCDTASNKSLVKNIYPYVPNWCRIDYANSQWSCEFGYDRNQH